MIGNRPIRAISLAITIALVFSAFVALTSFAAVPGEPVTPGTAPPAVPEAAEGIVIEAAETPVGPLVGLSREGVRAWAAKIGVPVPQLDVLTDERAFYETEKFAGSILTPDDADEVAIHGSDMAHLLGFDGTGVTVGVIDTGVDFAHPDLYNATFRVMDPASPYFLHPMAYDASSLNDYLIFGEPGPQSWFVSTSFSTVVVEFGTTRWVNWTSGNATRSWNVTGVAGLVAGEEVRIGFHPDDKLNLLLGMRPGLILFNDTGAGGPFDSVMTDLDGDFDMSDEKRAWINTDWATFDPEAELMFQDLDGDGIQDVSGGMVYFVSDGVREIPYASRQIDTLNFTAQTDLNNNSFDIWAGLDPTSNLVPGDGNLTLLFGDLNGPGVLGSHGTWVSSAIVGQGITGGFGGGPTLSGQAPGAKILGAGNNLAGADPTGYGIFTAEIFAAEGYDGVSGTGDEAQIASNSWGIPGAWGGWDWSGRFIDYVSTVLAGEDTLYVFSAGNSGPGLGARTDPKGGPSIFVAGAMENYFYRTDPWFALDGGPHPAFGDTAFFSTRGPSALGRHNVDAITSGQFGYGADPLNNNPFESDSGTSRNGNSSWVLWGGTSLAAPNLAGVTALVYDAFKAAHGFFPLAPTAKSIVKQGTQDAGQDPLRAGTGIADALRSVLMANDTEGLSIDVDEWNPGDYHSVDYGAYSNLLPAGGVDMATVTLANHRPLSTLDVTVADAILAHTGSLAFNFTRTPGSEPDQFLLNGSGIMTTDGTVLVPDGLGNWTTADSIRISVSFDRQRMIDDTPAYLYRVFDWTDVNGNGVSEGFNERNLMTQDFVSFAVLNGPNAQVFVDEPAIRSHDGLLLYNWPILDPPTPLTFFVEIDYFERMDWPWLSSSVGTVTIGPGATATVDLTVTVPAGAKPGLYEAMYLFTLDNGDVTTLPVVVNVGADTLPFSFGTSSEGDDGHYQQGQTYGEWWANDPVASGDWRYYFLDLPEAVTVTVLLSWDDPLSHYGLHVLTNVTDWFGENSMARYGPGTQDTIVSTDIEIPTGNGTAITAPLNEGLSIIAVQSIFVSGTGVAEHPRGQVGVVSLSPASLSGIGVHVEGTKTFTLTSDLAFSEVQGLVETGSEMVHPDLLVDSFPYAGQQPFAQYLFEAPSRFVTTIASGVSRASYEWFFHSGATDVDFGLFYDNDCDGAYTLADDVIGMAASTGNNPEQAVVNNPAPGCYVVHAAGFNVDPAGGLYDTTLTLVETPFVEFTSLPSSIAPGTPVTLEVDWTLPHISQTFTGNAFVGSSQFPRAIPVPISLLPDLPPMLSGLTPAVGAVLATNTPTIALDWQDTPDAFEGAVDPASLILIVDGAELSTLAVATTTGVALNLPFALADGVHSVFLEVHDEAGSQNRTAWAFFIDTAAPSLVITEPVVSITNDPDVSIAGSTDPGVTVTVSGRLVIVGLLGSFRVDLTLGDGAHRIPVVSTDSAGNSASTTVDIIVDTVAPSITLVSPPSTVEVASVTISGSTEAGADVYLNGIAVAVDATGAFSVNVALVTGSNTITAVAMDAAGNSRSTSTTVTFNDPVPGLQQDLDSANEGLNMARDVAAALQIQLFVAIAIAAIALVLAAVLFVLWWGSRSKP